MRDIHDITCDIIEKMSMSSSNDSTKNNKSTKDVSDGHHTLKEYLDMRNIYFIALCNAYPEFSWKSKKHYDEENDPISNFNGDFIAGINTPSGTISQHLKLEYWDELNVPIIENAPKYDNYTEEDVKIRIKSLRK